MIPAWVDGRLAPVEKLEAHARGLRHPAISAFVMRGEETLLQRRALSKYHTPGLWANACCTHPHWNGGGPGDPVIEDAAACAARRLDEELGIRGLALRLAGQVEYRADVGGGLVEHEVVDIFLAEAPADLALAPNPDEVAETRWTRMDALAAEIAEDPGRFVPWLRIYLAEHADRIFAEA